MPQIDLRGLSRSESKKRGAELLDYLGLGSKTQSPACGIVGWRAAARDRHRACRRANAPRILLADEPTGNLDVHTAERVFSTLAQLVRASGLATIIATTTWSLPPAWTGRVTTLREGQVVELA